MPEHIVRDDGFLEKIKFIGNVLGCIFSILLACAFAYSTINILYDSIIKESLHEDRRDLYIIISISLVFFGIYCSVLRNMSHNKKLTAFLKPFSICLWLGEFTLLCATQYFNYKKEINPNDIANKKIIQLQKSIERHEKLSEEYTKKSGDLTISQHKEKRIQGNKLLSDAKLEQDKADNDRNNLINITENNKVNFSVETGGLYNISRGIFIALILSIGTPFLFGKLGSFIKEIIDIINGEKSPHEDGVEKKELTSPSEKKLNHLKYLEKLLTTRNASSTHGYTQAQRNAHASKEKKGEINKIESRKLFNEKVKSGESIKCPVCDKFFIKNRSNQTFCPGSSCRYDYHNLINPKRVDAKNNRFNGVAKFPKLKAVDEKVVND